MVDPFTKDGESYVQDVVWGGYDANLRPEVVNVLNEAQKHLPFSIVLSSGYRDPARNRRVGGAKNSQHLTGNAVDISLKGLSDSQRAQLAAALSEAGGKRLGVYSGNTAIHLDMLAQEPTGDWAASPFYPMYDTTINRMESSPDWFKDLAMGKPPPIPPLDIPLAPPIPANKSALLSRLTSNPDAIAAAKTAGLPPLPRPRPKGPPASMDAPVDVAALYAGTPYRPESETSVGDLYRGIIPPTAPTPVPQPPMNVADVYRGIIPPPKPPATPGGRPTIPFDVNVPSSPTGSGLTSADLTRWAETPRIVTANLPVVPKTPTPPSPPAPTLPFPPSFPRATDPAWAGTRTAMSVTPTLRNGDVDTSFARPMWEGAGTLGPYATGLGDTGLGSLLRPPIDTRPRGPVNRGGRRSPLPVAPVPAVRTPTAPIPATRTPIRPPTPMPASMRPARRAPIEITVPTGSPPIPVPLPRLSRPEPKTSGIKMSPTLRDWIMGGDSSDETPRERRVSLR